MKRVHSDDKRHVQEIEGVAVFITKSRRHIGLAYSTTTSGGRQETRLLHLGWHGHDHFHDERGTSRCAYWIDPDVEPEQAQVISAHCRLVVNQNMTNGLPYGFGSPDGFFGTGGNVLPDGAKWGLTCATFVLAIFHLSGVPLVRYKTWLVRDDDRPWQEWVIRMLGQTRGVSPEHVRRNAESVLQGQIRFRPLEIAGAAASSHRPMDFEDAVRMAETLVKELDRIELNPQTS